MDSGIDALRHSAVPFGNIPGLFEGSEVKCIDLIAGARPNFMKIAPIVNSLKATQMGTSPQRLEMRGQGNLRH
jgi:hypothetical protein